jgi:hypothetical protein
MLTTLWLVLLILQAGTSAPVQNAKPSATLGTDESVIIIVK